MNILPEFESRQVLTNDELNWLASYLDSQNRLSRRMLIGCGLIGGLQVKLDNNTIQITNGATLTSAGHIVKLQTPNNITTYKKIKKYTQLKNAPIFALLPINHSTFLWPFLNVKWCVYFRCTVSFFAPDSQ